MVTNGRLLLAIDSYCKDCCKRLVGQCLIEDCLEKSCALWPVRRGSSQRLIEKPLRILGKRWTQEEERNLLRWAKAGKPREWICAQLFRTQASVDRKLVSLMAGEKLAMTILGDYR